MSYGRGEANPLERVYFFDNKRRPRYSEAGSDIRPNSSNSEQVLDEVKDKHQTTSISSQETAFEEAQLSPHFFCSDAAALPRGFQETSLRLFLTERDPTLYEIAQRAFESWCESRCLCSEMCSIREIKTQ